MFLKLGEIWRSTFSRLPRKEGAKKKKEGEKRAQKKGALQNEKEKRGRFRKKKKGGRKEGASKNTEKIPEKHAFKAKTVVK